MIPDNDRKGPGVKFPPPVVPLAFIAMGYGADFLLPLKITDTPLMQIIGVILFLCAFAIMINAVISFRRAKTHLEPWRKTSTIITSGIFSYSRNPIYLGFCIICISAGLIFNNLWISLSFLPTAGVIYFWVIRREEVYLEAKFGAEYEQYKQKVRRWL